MRGHDDEVCALAWSPVDSAVPGSREPLLASGCRARQVFLWRTETDGRAQARLSLPPHPFSAHARFPGAAGTASFYLCLSWPQPSTLVSNAMFGELLAWDLSALDDTTTTTTATKSKKGGWPPYVRMLHGFHSRAPYVVVCPPCPRDSSTEHGPENGDEQRGDQPSTWPRLVWTTSQDRNLVACCLHSGKLLAKIPTFSSAVYSIAASPLDPSRIGIGVGDAAIRIWNLNNTEEFDVVCHWQRIKSKVLSLSWHPLKENVLAFATGEGRVGLLMTNSNKPPIVFKMQHRGAVYSMCWGPYSYASGDVPDKLPDVALYTCGNGEVFQFDPSLPDECSSYPMEMLKLVSADKKAVHGSELLWKSDNTVFAAGLTDGSVHLFSAPHLVLLHSVYSIKKYIQMFAWHPESTATDPGLSPYCSWLAVAANEKTVRVFDFSAVLDGRQTAEDCSVLDGHQDKVPCLCWSPHISGQLLSVSYDGTAQVWDVAARTALVVFSGHEGSVFSCLWSPLDPDLVFTGGTDGTLHAWRVSRQTYQSVHELVLRKKSAVKRLKRATEAAEKQAQQQESAQTAVPTAGGADQRVGEGTEVKRMKPKSLLWSVKAVEEDKMEAYLAACRTLLAHSGEGTVACAEHEEDFPLLALYGDREAVCRLLDREASTVQESPALAESSQHLQVWRGDIAELLKVAAREKRLSTLLVSLAPLVSHRLWLETCQAYAEQLAEGGKVQKAASYLVACNRLEEAIALLADRDRFTDALVLAKCRLADPTLVASITRKWADRLATAGKLEMAAERRLVVGDLDAACQLYARSKQAGCHRLAALVARKAGQLDKCVSLAREALAEHLAAGKWSQAEDIVAEHPELQPLAVWSHVTRLLVDRATEPGEIRAWLGGSPASARPSLLQEVEECATALQVDRQHLGVALGELRNLSSQTWLEVSRQLCLAWTAVPQELVLALLLRALHAVYQTQLHAGPQMPLLQLCSWLSPAGPLAEGSVFCRASHPVHAPLVQSLRAYLCAAVVFWLEDALQGDTDGSWAEVCRVLGEVVDDAVDADVAGFCKAELQIKKLTASVASTACTEEARRELQELRLGTEAFEAARVCVPNPYFLFFKLQNACALLAQREPGAEALHGRLAQLRASCLD
ncbi:gem-associated protein 5-like [Bacillus rossius redtenbacheri]|uniref:gem-associated protein 5-like n=1 Tax=Bacillus rossius redtenbacheri TaxID=93214 RepID=UPI002FDE537D